MTLVRTAVIMNRTGNLLNLSAWASGLELAFGRQGMLRKALPLYRAYYHRDIHPDQHDNREALERAKQVYLRSRRHRVDVGR